MKRFIANLFTFVLFAIVVNILLFEVIFLCPKLSTVMSVIARDNHRWNSVYLRIIRSKQPIGSDTLILGDSVAEQIFPFRGGNKNYITSNGSVYIAGNYILAWNVLQRNPGVNRILFVSVPNVIGLRFERSHTLNNFLKPFYTIENIRHLPPGINKYISREPWAFAYLFRFVKFLPLDEINFDNREKERNDTLSQFSIENLQRLKKLCMEKGVSLKFASPPVPERLKEKSNDWQVMREQIQQNDLSDIFEGYFERIEYLPNSEFLDGLHLREEYLAKHRSRLEHIDEYWTKLQANET